MTEQLGVASSIGTGTWAAVITALIGIIAMFVKESVARSRKERKQEMRLSDGSQQMADQRKVTAELQTSQIQILNVVQEMMKQLSMESINQVTHSQLNTYCTEHAQEHRDLERKMDKLQFSHSELLVAIEKLSAKIDQATTSFNDIIGRHIVVGNRGE